MPTITTFNCTNFAFNGANTVIYLPVATRQTIQLFWFYALVKLCTASFTKQKQGITNDDYEVNF